MTPVLSIAGFPLSETRGLAVTAGEVQRLTSTIRNSSPAGGPLKKADPLPDDELAPGGVFSFRGPGDAAGGIGQWQSAV